MSWGAAFGVTVTGLSIIIGLIIILQAIIEDIEIVIGFLVLVVGIGVLTAMVKFIAGVL